jgi:hypothetical protein
MFSVKTNSVLLKKEIGLSMVKVPALLSLSRPAAGRADVYSARFANNRPHNNIICTE